MSEQGRMLGVVALKSPVVGGTGAAGQRGTDRVTTHTAGTQARRQVMTRGLSRRDLAVLSFVGRFEQVTPKHVHANLFKDNTSRTPCDRTLKRLTNQGYLTRVMLRTVGGAFGGSGQWVYQIGPEGWKEAYPGRPYRRATSPNYHTLDIVSTFIDIDQSMNVVRYATEPESHTTIAHMDIKPDLFVELDMGTWVQRVRLEIDLGTERPRQLNDKMSRYHYGLEHASDKQRRGWPLVLWVVPDERRKAELESLIKLQPAESRGMYRVCLFENVVDALKVVV